jgi:hypothetical protein
LKQRARAYVNGEIFLEYIHMVFLPNLNELQSLEEFADEYAVILMGNCSNRVGEEVLSLIRDARVRVIT